MLLEYTKNGEDLGYTGDPVSAVAIDLLSSRSLSVLVRCCVEARPECRVCRSDFDGIRGLIELRVTRNVRDC